MFGSFSVFWTATPLLLTSPAYGFTQRDVAMFALAGVAGAIAAPLAGRFADRGWTRPASIFCLALAVASYGLTLVASAGSALSIVLLVAAAILLDFGVSGNLVLGQRAIYGLGAELRSRVNGLYMATFFVGGAVGSALSAWTYARWGWGVTAVLGMAFPVAALLYFATEKRAGQTT
jgi:predicted MFS family arabinose efflux permease